MLNDWKKNDVTFFVIFDDPKATQPHPPPPPHVFSVTAAYL